MPNRDQTDNQGAGPVAMPRDEMNSALWRRSSTGTGNGVDSKTGNGTGAEAEEWLARLPLPQPHTITLHHADGALTVDWRTAPYGYDVALVRGRHEILNQTCINPPATLPMEALPAGQYCVVVRARTPDQPDGAEGDAEPCIVKLATPTQVTLTYHEQLQRLEVHWQPVDGASGYRVQLAHLVSEAVVLAGASSWAFGGEAPAVTAPPLLQAWVQAKGDERYYIDSNIGKSAPFALPMAGEQWGIFDITHFDRTRFFPEDGLPEIATDGSTWTGETDAQGQVYLDGLEAGVYSISFPDFDAADWGLLESSPPPPAAAIQEPAPVAPEQLTAGQTHWLVFELVDEDGQPIAGARYVVRRSNA